MGKIYKITNTINNKSYIGLTTRTVEERWKEHVNLAYSTQLKDSNTLFYKAIRKYGTEIWTIETIDECDDIELLKQKEQFYINKYNTYGFKENSQGYNSTIGGDGVFSDINYRPVVVINPIGFKVIEEFPIIKKAEEKYGRNVQETCARKINHHHSLIFYYKDEFDKMSQEELIKDVCNRIYIYCQIDFNGKLINTFTNIMNFCQENNFNQGNISECINKKRLSADNYQWCLYQDKDQFLGKVFKRPANNAKKVNQYTLDNQFIKQWDTIADAAKSLNKDSSHISAVCKGKRNSAYGYKWKYAD